MGSVRWRGGAAAVKQVQTYLFGGTWEADDLIRVTIGNRKYDFVAGSVTTNTVVTSLVAAWNLLSATDYPEFAEMTASASPAGTLMLTADTSGVPFTVTLTPLEANGSAADAQTIEGAGVATTGTAATAATGPTFWSEPRNWDTGAVPVNGDDVYLENSKSNISDGLAQSAVTLLSLNIAASFTGTLGRKELNGTYAEYRPTYLAIGATTQNVGDGAGRGSQLLRINNGTIQTTLNVHGTSSGSETDTEALLWKGTHAANVVNVTRGQAGVAVRGGEVATVATLRVGFEQSQTSDAQVRCGAGVTLTTLNMSGGQVDCGAGLTTVTKSAGALTIRSGNVTTLTDYGGTTVYRGAGTITTANVSKAKLDFGQDMRGRIITNTNLYAGAELNDPYGTVTFTNPFALARCGLTDVRLDLGNNRTYAVT